MRCAIAVLAVAALPQLASLQPAFAASHEQIIESCKQAHTEELRICVRGKLGNPRSVAPGRS
jgi:hypothetical protein